MKIRQTREQLRDTARSRYAAMVTADVEHPLMHVVHALITYYSPTKLHLWSALQIMEFINNDYSSSPR